MFLVDYRILRVVPQSRDSVNFGTLFGCPCDRTLASFGRPSGVPEFRKLLDSEALNLRP